MQTTANHSDIYVAVTGTNCIIDGQSGYVTGFHKEGPHLLGVFVKVPTENGEGPVLYVKLGESTDDRGNWRKVVSFREIDRDEFDRLTTIDTLRRDLGWK